MPKYSVVGEDGKKYNVEARAGLDEYQLQSLVAEHIAERKYKELLKKRDELSRPLPEEPPKRTVGGYAKEFLKGIPAGAIGLLETSGTGISAALPEEAEKYTREKISGLASLAKKPFEAAPGYEDTIPRKLAEGVGSTAPFFLLGPAGLAGRAGIGALAAGAGAGEARVRAEQAGATAEERRSATGLGTVVGIGELLAPFGADKVVGRFRRIAAASGIEGAQEAASELAQNMIEQGIYNPEKEIISGVGEAGAYGAGVGALIQALLDMAFSGRVRGAKPKGEEPKGEAPKIEGMPGEQMELFGTPPKGLPPAETRPDFTLTPPEAAQGQQLDLDLQEKAAPVSESTQPDLFGDVDNQRVQDLTQAYIDAGVDPVDAQRLAAQEAGKEAEADQQFEEESKQEAPRGAAPSPAVGQPTGPAGIEPSVGVSGQSVQPEGQPVPASEPTTLEPARLDSTEKPAPTGVGEEGTVPPALDLTPPETAIPEEPKLQVSQLTGRTRVKKKSKPLAPATEAPKTEAKKTGPTEADIAKFAARITAGEKLTSPEDVQFYQNNAAAIEVELNKAKAAADKLKRAEAAQRKADEETAAKAKADEEMAAKRAKANEEALKKTEAEKQVKLVPKASPEATRAAADYVAFARSPDRALDFLAGDIYYAITPSKLDKEAVAKTDALLAELKEGRLPKVKFGIRKDSGEVAPSRLVSQDNGKRASLFLGSLTLEQTKDVAKRVAKYINTERRGRRAVDRIKAKEKALGKSAKARKAYEESILEDDNPPDKITRKLVYSTISDIETDDLGLRKAERELASKYLTEDAVFDGPVMHPAVEDTLRDGDLNTALSMTAQASKGRVSRIAKRLADVLKGTKVEVVDNLTDEAGNPVAGLFDPKTNTIKLDSELGLNYHTLLHEAGHAATSATLANKSHPLTKQLTKLYESIKGGLGTAYGSQSLEEFVAEAWSNPKFQDMLSTITPDGSPISAWQRFKNAVANFFRNMLGMDSKPASALDKVDTLVADILAPSPEYRDAGTMYQIAGAKLGDKFLDGIASMVNKLPEVNKPWADTLHAALLKVPSLSQRGILSSLPLHAFVEVAEKAIPSIKRLRTLIDEKHGSERIRNKKIDATIRDVEAWAKRNPKLVEPLNDVVYASTVERVDPSKSHLFYAKDDAKLKAWDDMQAKWKSLGKEGQAVYEHIRDTYKKLNELTKAAFEARLDGLPIDKDSKAKIKKTLYDRLFDNGVIEPYFPLTRTGKQWLSYTYYSERTGNLETFVELFETPAARERVMKEITAEAYKDARMKQQAATLQVAKPNLSEKEAIDEILKMQTFAKVSEYNYRSAPSTSFVSEILGTMEKAKRGVPAADAERVNAMMEQVTEAFLNLLPESSFAQSFRRRKETEGYNRDVIGALKSKGYSLSRQLANIEYGAKLEQLAADIRADYKKAGSPEDGKAYFDESISRIGFAKSPEIPEWSRIATSVGFIWTLGGNVSSAVINLSQIPLVVVPYLAFGRGHGLTETIAAIGKASRIFMQSGTNQEVETLVGGKKVKMRTMPSIDNYDFSKNPKLAHLKVLVEEAQRMAKLNRSMTQDILEFGDKQTFMSKVNKVSGFLFHHGERMNRQVALVAAYELNLAKSKDKGEEAQRKAAQQALYDVELTNGGTASEAIPTIAQSGIGKIIFMYKNYGVSMYYMLFKAARQALKEQDPALRKAAWGQLAGIYGSAALFAGARGLPMMGVLAMVYNMFSDDDEDDFDTMMRKGTNELISSGLINYLTNVDVSSRIGLSDLLFRDTTVKDQDSVLLSLMETIGGPVFGIASRVERGIKLIGEGHADRGIEQMLPSAMGSVLKSIRYATEGTQTLRGDPITGEVNAWNVGAQLFGFAPADYIEQLEKSAQAKKIDRAASEERTKLTKRYYMAARLGDSSGMQDAVDQMMDFNKRHPSAAITGDTIRKSMQQHQRTTASMIAGVSYSKNMLPEIRARLAEYDRDIDED